MSTETLQTQTYDTLSDILKDDPTDSRYLRQRKAYVREWEALNSRYDVPDGFCMPAYLKYSDREHSWVKEGGIYDDAQRLPSIQRLEHISQLSYLRFVTKNPESVYGPDFSHSRYQHTLQVARISEIILENNGFDQETINHGIVAALFHDIATPAGGDATKKNDQAELHEELHWYECIQDPITQQFLEDYGIDIQILDDIIRNKGTLGKVLDIADKVAYTTEDIYNITNFPDPLDYIYYKKLKKLGGKRVKMPSPPDNFTDTEVDMYDTFRIDIGNVAKDVRIDPETGEPYFTHPHRLYSLLKTRADLSLNLYLHPQNQARDTVFRDLINPLYTPENNSADDGLNLSPQILRNITDRQLFERVKRHWGLNYQDTLHLFGNFNPEVQSFDNESDAIECTLNVLLDPQRTYMFTETIPAIHTGTDWLVKVPNSSLSGKQGEIATLKDAYPTLARRIDSTAAQIPRYYVASHINDTSEMGELMMKLYGPNSKQAA